MMGEVTLEKTERNAEIYRRYKFGEMPTALSKEYALSPSRIAQIVRQYGKKRGER